MLPGSGLRHRGSATSVTDGMNRLSSVMNDSVRRYRRLPFVGKVIFFLSLVFSLVLYAVIFHYFVSHDVTHDNFLDVPKCPACFGSSGCGLIYYNQIQLSGWAGYKLSDTFNTKNIRYATMSGYQKVVLKKYGTDQELAELDRKVCRDANRPENCDVPRVLFLTNTAAALQKEPLQPKHLLQSAGMFTCASYRLLDRMWKYYKEARKTKQILLGDKMQVWYTASLNPEPLMLQTFPASERWPFPEYFGACGRQVIVEHVGRTLQDFYHEPFHKRAGLAYELLKIADHLTHNEEDFALYITDPNWSNFGVDASGKVRILDAENIIVVDKLAIDAKKPRHYDEFLESKHDLCTESSCVSMRPDQLCTRLHSDHNYYAICTNLLDPALNDGIMPGGLLHDMPEKARDFWDLEHLLRECARPSKPKGRLIAKAKLLSALSQLHDQSEEHLHPPPDIDKSGVRQQQPKKDLWEYDDYDDDSYKDAADGGKKDGVKKEEGGEKMKDSNGVGVGEGGEGEVKIKKEGENEDLLGKKGVVLE